MNTPLLATKLYIPPLRQEVVSRPRLIDKLNAGLACKLTLISAPAGFGKSSLLSEWAAKSERRITWISLNIDDNHPNRFWSYFITSISSIHEDFGGGLLTSLQSRQTPPINELLTDLINHIVDAALPDFSVVLDDYHLINAPDIHAGVEFLIENCPPSLHLVISTRSDPLLPLGRFRVRGEMNELRTNDLRFTLHETTSLFNDILGLGIHKDDIEALERRTEGWIAGLQMVAISIKERLRTQDPTSLSEYIADFTGSHRFVLDYLVEEVINLQSPKVKDFLLKTSILERFNTPLCQAVTGYADCHEILKYLDQANLFLIPLDEGRSWYRYHHLFRDLLKNLLEWESPSQESVLHLTASKWFEANGLLAEAVKHALSMDDVERFGRLIAGNAVYLVYIGELHTIERWLSDLPDETMCSSPWLCIAHAWVNAYLGEHDRVSSLLENTHQILKDPGTGDQYDEQQKCEILAHINLIQGFRNFFTGDFEDGITRIRTALENLSDRDCVVRSYAFGLLGAMLRANGSLGEAKKLIEESIRLSRKTGFEQLAADALTDLMSLQISQGRWQDAAAVGREALQLDKAYCTKLGKHLFTVGRIHYFFGSIYLNWNELENALQHLKISLELAQKWGKADEIALGFAGLAWVHLAQGDTKSALTSMRDAKQAARKISPRWEMLGDLAEARLHLRLGNIDTAISLSQGFDFQPDHTVLFVELSEYLFFARLLAEQEKFSDALAIFDRLKTAAETAGAKGDLLPILVAQVTVFQKMNKNSDALDVLAYALSLAEPEKSVRVFIDAGVGMAELLRKFNPGDETYHYAMQVLAAIENQAKDHRLPDMLESLSKRELEVLMLLATPLTHAEIAEKLYISRNTVRSHVKRIYSKLNVNNRIRAIEKGKDFGLI